MAKRASKAKAEEGPQFLAPQGNPELFGQDEAEQRLAQAWRSGRLPHAWLLSGPRGIGKATLAYRFARFVLAGKAETGGLFGEAPAGEGLALETDHPVFRQVAAGGHPDLMTVARGVNPKTGKLREEIVVEDVRAVRDFMHMTASAGGWRVVVVDAADELNRSAANALLKVLEEPPAKGLLLLVSHAPGRLLPTIRSRCCALPLAALPEPEIAALLARTWPDLAEADRAALARLAEGSAGRALALAAGGGLTLYREVTGLMAELPRLDAKALHALADRWARDASGEAFRTGMDLMVWWLGRLVRAAATGGSPGEVVGEVVEGEAALIARLAARARLDQWLGLWDKVSRLPARAGGLNLDRKQVVLTAFFELEALAR